MTIPTKQFQFAVALLIAIAAPATAQSTPLFNFITRTSIPIVIQCPGCNAANRNKRPKTTKVTVTKAEIGKFSYNPSAAVRQRIITQLAEDVRENDPDAAQKIEQNFISNDVIGRTNKIMVASGLNSNNLADAYAFYWANAWQAFSGRNENLSKTEIAAIRSQTTRILLATPQLVNATDAQKQGIAELMMIQAVFVSATIDNVKSDPTQLANAKASIARGAKSFGLDFDRMTLTPQGFQFTK
jgi:hypothetical protein